MRLPRCCLYSAPCFFLRQPFMPAAYRDADVAAQRFWYGPREKATRERYALNSSKATEVPDDKKNGKLRPCMI